VAVIGVGIDVVDIERFMASLERTAGLRERLFTPAEAVRPPASLAARFAAKEAMARRSAPRPGWPGTTPRWSRSPPAGRC
jgi:phosphopantetheine--protein transferase-like protein